MKITFIYHSSFLVETEKLQMLFDYFQGDLSAVSPDKPLYVFASHRHEDHFSPVIFELAEKYPEVHYVLSYDIWKKRVPEKLRDRTVFLKPHVRERVGALEVETLKSTDEGVAFLIQDGAHTIYHAGDLNDWTWDGEPETDNEAMSRNYRKEMDLLKGRHIDVAFVVLDGRQEQYYRRGIDYFTEQVGADQVCPMHYWGDPQVVERYRKGY
ncbi:MAG: MBL fold metallo-hydrolase [Candidatus Limivivens sp.]|nr:MBL fold metallo-hydrolase [Candidatus Limivivens sp.]